MSIDLTSLLSPAQLPEDAVEVARIGEAWGIKGWFRVIPYHALTEALFACKQWYLLPAERGARHFTGTLALDVAQVREHGDGLVAHSRSIPDRNGSELLKGARICVPRCGALHGHGHLRAAGAPASAGHARPSRRQKRANSTGST